MQFAHPDWKRVTLLGLVFAAMIVTWATVSPARWPFHYTAIAGAAAACIIIGRQSTGSVLATYDLKTTLFMAITLAGAAITTATSALDLLANVLSANIVNPVALLFVVMAATMVAAALFQAGPAAAGMLPVIAALADGPLRSYGDWVYVAFAGSICAGSSMFIFSATSGPALVGEAQKAGIRWGILEYLPHGVSAAVLQFVLVALWIAYAVVPGLDFWYALIGSVFMLGGLLGIVAGAIMRKAGKPGATPNPDSDRHGRGTGILRLSIIVELIGIITTITTKVIPWKW